MNVKQQTVPYLRFFLSRERGVREKHTYALLLGFDVRFSTHLHLSLPNICYVISCV